MKLYLSKTSLVVPLLTHFPTLSDMMKFSFGKTDTCWTCPYRSLSGTCLELSSSWISSNKPLVAFCFRGLGLMPTGLHYGHLFSPVANRDSLVFLLHKKTNEKTTWKASRTEWMHKHTCTQTQAYNLTLFWFSSYVTVENSNLCICLLLSFTRLHFRVGQKATRLRKYSVHM